jgi:hypothetical protein
VQEALSIPPELPKTPVFFHTPELRSGSSGMDEFFLNDDFEYFEKAQGNISAIQPRG